MAKKAITHKWLQAEQLTVGNWFEIIKDIGVMEKVFPTETEKLFVHRKRDKIDNIFVGIGNVAGGLPQ